MEFYGSITIEAELRRIELFSFGDTDLMYKLVGEYFSNYVHTLEEFEVQKVLAESGATLILLVRYLGNGKLYALKQIPLKSEIQQATRLNELDMMLAVRDIPNVVKCYDVFESWRAYVVVNNGETELKSTEIKSTCYPNVMLTLDYFPHGDLLDYINEGHTDFGLKQIVNVWIQLLDIVDQLYQKKFFHQDIKPDNIFIAKIHEDGCLTVVLGDWGYARKEDDLTFINAGTPMYCAPETLLSMEEMWKLGSRGLSAECWSITITIYTLLMEQTLYDLSLPCTPNQIVNTFFIPRGCLWQGRKWDFGFNEELLRQAPWLPRLMQKNLKGFQRCRMKLSDTRSFLRNVEKQW